MLSVISTVLSRLAIHFWAVALLVVFVGIYVIDKRDFSTQNLACAHLMMAWAATNVTALLIYLDSRS